MKETQELLCKAKFIDYDNVEYDLSEIKGKEHLEYSYSIFNILAKPIVKLINDSESTYVLFIHNDRDKLFTIVNMTEEIKEKLLEYNIRLQ